jgi:dienelactone hydrolase
VNVLRCTARGFLGLLIFCAIAAPVCAQQEFLPPKGKGRVVVVISGHDGAPAYRGVAGAIAQLGYDAVLFDANSIAANDTAATLRSAVQQAQQMPHALPGKVGLVGFSQGGGQVLIYGSQMPDIASIVIAWYPATRSIADATAFAARLRVPVLMLAGEMDHNGGCCEIGTARILAAAAIGRQFELVSYPNTQHAFIYGSYHYNPVAYADGMQRTAAELAEYLGRQ